MTPPEVVGFMVKLATIGSKNQNRNPRQTEFLMMDPACGVGSFITCVANRISGKACIGREAPPFKMRRAG